MNIELLHVQTNSNDTGALSFIEAERHVPFPIQRIYYIYHSSPNAHRGFHAHKALRQLLICAHGEIEVILDDGTERRTEILNDPSVGLFVLENIWHEMIWKQKDSVLLVLASNYYNESDYIRDYDDFLKHIKD